MKYLKTIGAGFSRFGKGIYGLWCKAPLIFCLVSSFALNFAIEIMARHSLIEGARFIFMHPFMFLVGWTVVFYIFLLSLIIPKGFAWWLTAFAVWLAFGITNCVMSFLRSAPFTGSDFGLLKSVFPIITVYLSIFQLIMISSLIGGALVGLVFLWVKLPANSRGFKDRAIKTVAVTLFIAILIPILVFAGAFPTDFTDLNKAYRKYGFVYGFCASVFTRGIDEPDGYGSESIEAILNRLDSKKQEQGDGSGGSGTERPNVIFVQLESFFDVSRLNGVTFSENPIPNFTALKEAYPSAKLTVPLIGAGTANTEFEILTGMNLDFFGAGECPYDSVLGEKVSCDSVAYAFSKLGYATHAMHNNTGTFYDRHLVYPNLGFDTFTPVECMYGVEYNALEWAKDSVLTEQIFETLSSTDERDFVFTVSVQAHGKYPEELMGKDYGITVDAPFEEELLHKYSYYVNQLKGTDSFIGELVQRLQSFEEPTAVLFYGDHLPYLDIAEEQLSDGTLYQTEYVLWSNYGLENTVSAAEDCQSYQVGSYVFEALGADGGIMHRVHSYLSGESDYLTILETLEYDMLFGDKYVYRSGGEPVPKEIRYGIRSVNISSVSAHVTGEDGERTVLTVKGSGFNEFSVIYVNGKECDGTECISEGELRAVVRELEKGDAVKIVQQAADGTEFAVSAEIIIK